MVPTAFVIFAARLLLKSEIFDTEPNSFASSDLLGY
jgi:hypothetical protein